MQLYNTLTRELTELSPIEQGRVRLYTCGLTVYSQPHIGNWVSYIYWDLLHRTMLYAGLEVNRVQNITDVGHLVSDADDGQDKMEKGAAAEGLTAWQIADKYIAIADAEARKLNLLEPTMVRATDCINKQIEFVEQLEKDGYTYLIPGEGVYFDTSKVSQYGQLAKLDSKGLNSGARVADVGKKNPTDFAVWKLSPKDAKRDMEWDSPWGMGFPGWHLECSVIARENLGDQIDIHTGGIDHIPVHHTNEIAQTESVTGRPFSSIWMHNNFLKVDGKKMAKSEGTIITLKDIEDKGIDLMAFRLMVLSKHYRTEGNITWDILESAGQRLARWRTLSDMRWQSLDGNPMESDEDDLYALLEEAANHLLTDIDSPKAIASFEELFGLIETKGMLPGYLQMFTKALEQLRDILGIDILGPDISIEQKQLLTARQEARTNKDWQSSDVIRDQLLESGVAVKDGPHGQVWSRA